MDIPNLPLEVVIHILEYLSLSDRKQARLVCHQWYCASQDSHLLQKETVVFDKAATSSHMSTFLDSNRDFFHFLFMKGDINWRLPDFWNRFGPNLRSLSIFFCDIHEREFIDILSCCPRLTALRTCGCRELLMSGRLFGDEADVKHLKSVLVNLKELSIAHNSYLSDALLNRFIAICPAVESLSLRGCQISFHQGLYKKFYPAKSGNEITDGTDDEGPPEILESTSILTFRNILNHIRVNAAQITELCFSETLIDSPALRQLSQVANLRLNALRLSGCDQLSNPGVVTLTQNQSQLELLDLSCCSRVSDPAIKSVCRNLTSLKHLSAQCCRGLTDYSIYEIHRLGDLVSLDISQCNQVTGEGITGGIATTSHREKLRKLHLRGINNMTHDVVVRLAQNLPNLTELDLSFCFTAVTDVSIQAIFQHQVWLRCLNLNGCSNITDAGLTGMGMGTLPESSVEAAADAAVAVMNILPASPKISLGSRAEDEILKDAKRKKAVLQMCMDRQLFDIPTGYSVARLKGLESLSLQGCSRISDVSLFYAFKFLELHRLDLAQCHQVTHAGLKSLSENNPSIEILRLDQCLSVTDDAVLMLVSNLRRLKNLSLQGCEKLTNESLRHISGNCDSLRRLDMRHCARLERTTWTQIPLEKITILLLPPAFSESAEYLPPPPPPQLPTFLRRS